MNQVKLRRYQNLLIVSGTGVVFFGLWSVIKAILTFLTQSEVLLDSLKELPEGIGYRIIFFAIIGTFLASIIGIRLIVGLSARAVGYGKMNRWFYLVFAFLLAIGTLVLIAFDVYYMVTEDLIDDFVALVVDVTSVYTTIELIVASFMVRKLTKAQKEG